MKQIPVVRPADTSVVAPKVIASSIVGSLLGGATTLASALQSSGIFGTLPAWLQTIIGLVAGGVFTGIAGYLAPHQSRQLPTTPDVP